MGTAQLNSYRGGMRIVRIPEEKGGENEGDSDDQARRTMNTRLLHMHHRLTIQVLESTMDTRSE